MEEWAAKSAEARAKLTEQREKDGMDGRGDKMPKNVGGVAGEDGGDLFEGIPVGIREFMRTEKKLKERHRREGSMGG
jgi:hypothetical protein